VFPVLVYFFLVNFICTAIRRLNDKQPAKSKGKRLSLRKGQVSAPLTVPENIPRPPYVDMKDVPDICREIQVHNSEGIAQMRDSCKLAAQVLEYAGTLVRVGTFLPLAPRTLIWNGTYWY
jgi:hypothetical protein